MIPIKRHLETLRRAGAESVQDYLGLGGGMFLPHSRKEGEKVASGCGWVYICYILHHIT